MQELYCEENPRLSYLMLASTAVFAARGIRAIQREGRLSKLPLVGRFFAPIGGHKMALVPPVASPTVASPRRSNSG